MVMPTSQKRPKSGGKRPFSAPLPQPRKRSHDGTLLVDQDDQKKQTLKQPSPAESSLGGLFESAHSHQDYDDDDDDDDEEDRGSAPKAITVSDDVQGGEPSDENDSTPGRNSNEHDPIPARGPNENGSITARKLNGNKRNSTREANGDHSVALKGVHGGPDPQDQARQERERQEKELQEIELREQERLERAKFQLVTALMQITELASGTFATHGHIPNAINPGLSIVSIGGIGLPLSGFDAQRLKTVSRPLLSARVNSTVAGTTTGSIWEMYPTQIILRNPLWGQFLTEILVKVVPALGISPDGTGVQADLQRLFLYEQGVFTDLRREYATINTGFVAIADCNTALRNPLMCLGLW